MFWTRTTLQALKKRLTRFFIFAMAGVVVLSAIAFCPAPIEGNWWSSIGCGCESHSFVRFEAGRILLHEGHPIPFEWLGNYERVGFCKYKLSMFHGAKSIIVKSHGLFVQPREALGIICRDPFILACWRILRQPEKDWLDDPRCICLSIRKVGGETVYSWGDNTMSPQTLEAKLAAYWRTRNRLNNPIHVYSTSNVCPVRILSAITANGFESVIHTNQMWISDVQKNNLVVRAFGGGTHYFVDGKWIRTESLSYLLKVPEGERREWWKPVSAVFVPAEGTPESLRQILAETGYRGAVFTNHPWCAACDPQDAAVVVGQDGAQTLIWLDGIPYTVDQFENRMCGRKSYRTGLNMPLVVYAENAIVPPDLAQMLSRVGCAYETRSVELLRRSK